MTKTTFSPKCGNCRQRTMALDVIAYEVVIDHDGRKYIVRIPDLVVPKCTNCGDFVLNDSANERINIEFHNVANLLTPQEICTNLERLNLTQRSFAEEIRVSESTVSRWVTGAQIQQGSLDLLMRLFFEEPKAREFLHRRAGKSGSVGTESLTHQC